MNLMQPKASISESEFLLFKDYISKISGIVIPVEKTYFIETRLSRFIAEAGVDSFSELYKYILSGKDPEIEQKIVNAVVVNETLWFRDNVIWKALEEIFLPKLINDLQTGKKTEVRIWCAAVSTGQEAYSTAMCIDNYLKVNNIKGVSLSDFVFYATDISNHVLDIAKKGRYDKISIKRGLGDYYKEKYFTTDGLAWDIDPKIRDAVQFRQFDLRNSYSILGQFDIIFCRYVLIYFSPELKKEILIKLRNALKDDGVLFTGYYALYEYIEDILMVDHYENLSYYSKKEVLTS